MGIGAWGGKGAGGALVQVPSKEVRAGKLGHEGWGAVGGRPEGWHWRSHGWRKGKRRAPSGRGIQVKYSGIQVCRSNYSITRGFS